MRFVTRLLLGPALFVVFGALVFGQSQATPESPRHAVPALPDDGAAPDPSTEAAVPPQPGETEHELAEEQIKKEEKQRILGVVPEFNISNLSDAVPLSPGQKWELAFKSVTDPFTFVMAGIDAGMSQGENEFAGYGQGAQGYGKRFGASYADTFDGTMLGNALFPILLRQDPRYFRKGTGTFTSRLLYAVSTTVICKGDNGRWQPNFSNMLGNIAAGGIANLYYPPADRGAGLTFERAFTVSAEGAIGAVFYEFWPDISPKLFHKHETAPASAAGQE